MERVFQALLSGEDLTGQLGTQDFYTVMGRAVTELRRERDELREALEALVRGLTPGSGSDSWQIRKLVAAARRALHKDSGDS
jgi:hypothetical protein